MSQRWNWWRPANRCPMQPHAGQHQHGRGGQRQPDGVLGVSLFVLLVMVVPLPLARCQARV